MFRQQFSFTKFVLVYRKPFTGSSSTVPKVYYTRYFSSDSKKQTGWAEWRDVLTKFLPLGLCLIAVMQWRAFRQRNQHKPATQLEINVYCMLPLRTVSRCWGWLADVKLPEFTRPYVYGLYSNTFGVNISEALNEDLKSYPSLADFFSRAIKEDVRKIDIDSSLVSPCDGTVLHLGPVTTEQIEQVKGVTYTLGQFFGENTWNNNNSSDYRSSLLHGRHNTDYTLYQCVIYLAPGDYHRFHSPADWKPTHRRHFHGELLSVNPRIAKWIPGLFCLNERSIYLGEWEHGFFSYTAVGATNVGTIKVYFDRTLQTNHSKKTKRCRDLCLGNGTCLKKGEVMGEFRMGSTIVLVFQAPTNFKFNVCPGDKVKMGQSLGDIAHATFSDRITRLPNNFIKNAN